MAKRVSNKKKAAAAAPRKASAKRPAKTKARASAGAGRDFPRDFLWGAATSATQVDGGDKHSDWYQFSLRPGAIADGDTPDVACDHWHRYRGDYQFLRKIGLNAYRFGVDWSRFQPDPDTPFRKDATDHLRKMLYELQLLGVRPLLTLFHFALPQWWAARGGFSREENLPDFVRFAEHIIEHCGDLVSDYITINEPNVYALISYVDGRWPPGRRGIGGYLESLRVLRNLASAHFQIYDRIHNIHSRRHWSKPRVSIAKHLRYMVPANPNSALDRDRCDSAADRFNWNFLDILDSGELRPPLGRSRRIHDGGAMDFIGLNYYTRDRIAFALSAFGKLFIQVHPVVAERKTDLGWEIYPEGMYQLLLQLRDRYPGRPLWITENGLADAADTQRARFIDEHLAQLARAMREGAPVEAYFHWSLLDNFEWADGYAPRFGLVAVDYSTQKRSLRPSAEALRQIIRSGRAPLASID